MSSSKIPDFSFGVVHAPNLQMQLGCIYCLAENLEAPTELGVAYFYQGTSMCMTHVRSTLGGAVDK